MVLYRMNIYEKPFNFNDNLNDFKPTSFYKGHVVMVDDASGEVILEKDNLVVLRGRTFALEKMFDKVSEKMGYNTENISAKTICLWKAGNGGCYEGKYFDPVVVNADCQKLGEGGASNAGEMPFIYVDKEKINDKDIKEKLKMYAAPITDENDPRVLHYNNKTFIPYYAKRFSSVDWVVPSEDVGHRDEIALKITLNISEDDFKLTPTDGLDGVTTFVRDTYINEIGLCIAVDDAEIDYNTVELATRFTFESEPYKSELKSATLYYYIYA